MFPSAKIPSYPTISRWLKRRPPSNVGLWRWGQTVYRVSELLEERMDELQTMPFDKLTQIASRMYEMHLSSQAAMSRR